MLMLICTGKWYWMYSTQKVYPLTLLFNSGTPIIQENCKTSHDMYAMGMQRVKVSVLIFRFTQTKLTQIYYLRYHVLQRVRCEL